MALRLPAEDAVDGPRKQARSDRTVVLRCRPIKTQQQQQQRHWYVPQEGSEHVFTRPLSDIQRYPDSLLATMLRDLGAGGSSGPGGSKERSVIELRLGDACEPGPLEIALHIHAHSSICGAPLPPDVTLDWLRTEVLQRYKLPAFEDLKVVPITDPALMRSSLPTLTRLLREAALEGAVTGIIQQANPLAHVSLYSKHHFVFTTTADPKALRAIRIKSKAELRNIREYSLLDNDILVMVPELSQKALGEVLQRVLPSCKVLWERRSAEVDCGHWDSCSDDEEPDEDDSQYDVMTLVWG